jgi:GR25 family glycosyltransferase involved in LPS biosynthesis
MSLTPEPVRTHDGPFLPIIREAWSRLENPAAAGRHPLLLRPRESRLQVYYISLKPRPVAQAKLAQLLGDRIPASRQAVVRGVPAAEALSAAGVPAEAADAFFGEQAREPEFLAALGCTMSHLFTARRALAEGADPALVLEEDVVLDLEPFWLVRHFDSLVDAFPAHWQAVQLSLLATPNEWSELRLGWQRALETWGAAATLKSDFFWSTAAYLLHPRGMRALAQRYQPRANQTSQPAWRLGTDTVRCVKADVCVMYPGVPAPAVYAMVPPMFVSAERVRSSIDGHDQGQQHEVHLMSRMQALDLAAEAYRERIQRNRAPLLCASRPASEASELDPERYVYRRSGAASLVFELRRPGTLAQFSRRLGLFTPVGTWHALGAALLLARKHNKPQLFCREAVGSGYAAAANATGLRPSSAGLVPLIPPSSGLQKTPADSSSTLGFKFWLHDNPAMDWLRLLPCLPDWDHGMDSQNSAEIWLLRQLQAHPNRTDRWQDANVVVLPLLLKTSLQAATCQNSTHQSRLRRSIAAMRTHPAYQGSHGHDHLVLFNYWDAWSAVGPRGSDAYHAFENISLGWHETYDAAWGMANHRYVGKCQVSLPYVEPPQCAALSEEALLRANRTTSLFFAGARGDFDTGAGCPNVLNHSVRVRHALFGLKGAVPGALLRQTQHNMRYCNTSSACEANFKRRAADEMVHSRYCAVAAGDTPTTGRLFDAISCLCVPVIVADDAQLPFPVTSPIPAAAFGVRLPEATFLRAPSDAISEVLVRSDYAALQQRLLRARRALAYRAAGSRVATLALREAWATCLSQTHSRARPPSEVAKC